MGRRRRFRRQASAVPLWCFASVRGRRDHPNDLGDDVARIAAAMRVGALEREAIASLKPDLTLALPEIERPLAHEAGLVSGMAVGLVAAGGARLDDTKKQLERSSRFGDSSSSRTPRLPICSVAAGA